ncbi:MAG TPA: GAF domain-containing protein [Cyclobacteriaceae bacterium]
MNFLRNRSLAFQYSFLLAVLAFFFLVQYLVVRHTGNTLEQLHYQRDVARKTQLMAQDVYADVVLHADGRESARDIGARLAQLAHAMDVLSDGGRVEGSTLILDPLPRLPRIAFDELQERWVTFIETVERITDAGPGQSRRDLSLARTQWEGVSSWYNRLVEDLDTIIAAQRSLHRSVLAGVGVFDIALCFAMFFLFRRMLLDPLKLMRKNTASHNHTTNLPPNELGVLAAEVNHVIEQLKDASDFVKAIGDGDLSIRYETFDKDYKPGTNRLADSLVDMQSRLRQLNEEDQKRQWTNEGLTKFVDILRSGNDDLRALGDKIISTLATYTGSNQGGLYLLNDANAADTYLELVSLFAFDVKKHETRRIKIGEGILGQTFLEKQTTYLKSVPEEYVRITSGLGEGSPSSLLVVPLKIDQDVFGVVELASFNPYPDHVIRFVERLGETIASTVATVRAAQRNRELLEEARQATEMMRSQEEEMRQNMEELQATQEEMARKERDYVARITDLEAQLAGKGSAADVGK